MNILVLLYYISEIDDIPLKRSRTTRRKKKSAELFSDDSESDTLPNEKHFKMKGEIKLELYHVRSRVCF